MSTNRLLRRILEFESKGNMKKGKIKRNWIAIIRCMNNRRLTEENTREKNMKGDLVLVKKNHCTLDCCGTNDKG